jgi:hypothetical protein
MHRKRGITFIDRERSEVSVYTPNDSRVFFTCPFKAIVRCEFRQVGMGEDNRVSTIRGEHKRAIRSGAKILDVGATTALSFVSIRCELPGPNQQLAADSRPFLTGGFILGADLVHVEAFLVYRDNSYPRLIGQMRI